MMATRGDRSRFGSACLVLVAGLGLPEEASASGTHFLIELQSGLSEPAHAGGTIGPAIGVSAGTTFKLKLLPVRWYLLATALGRYGGAHGIHQGLAFTVERRDIDVFGSVRSVYPVFGFVRLYAEIGVGQRRLSSVLERGGGLGNISQDRSELLLVVAAGAQARVFERFSFGLRAEVTPLLPDPDIVTYSVMLPPTDNRLAIFAQLGIHF